jgi:hypothetical protein
LLSFGFGSICYLIKQFISALSDTIFTPISLPTEALPTPENSISSKNINLSMDQASSSQGGSNEVT